MKIKRFFKKSYAKLAPPPSFIKDFRLPLSATTIFVLILVALFLLRGYERLAVANILDSRSGEGQDYAALLSKDKDDELKKNNDTQEEVTTTATSNSEPLTVTPTVTASDSSSTESSGGSTETGGGTETGGDGDEPPPEEEGGEEEPPPPPPPPLGPFTAEILRLVHEGTSNVICNPPTPPQTTPECYKKYFFRSDVRTINGPGTVSYKWNWGPPASYRTGSIDVGGPSETYTSLHIDISKKCSGTGTTEQFGVGFQITAPNQTSAGPIMLTHTCSN